MIVLDVKSYCSDCLSFEPDVESPVRYYADFEVVSQSDTIVRCKHRRRCDAMVRYLERHPTKGESNGDESK